MFEIHSHWLKLFYPPHDFNSKWIVCRDSATNLCYSMPHNPNIDFGIEGR